MTEIIPSDTTPDALAAMERLVDENTTIRAAVAFATDAGVDILRGLVDGRRGVTLEVVARAADVTSPAALLALRDELGAAVSVVIGRHASAFHPKLWLFETGDVLTVLSGSGNLTSTGLRGNDEQFELATMAADGPEAAAQA
ncbi:MAG: phospholipase D family protein, partial [Solirubrobacterales bacterium]